MSLSGRSTTLTSVDSEHAEEMVDFPMYQVSTYMYMSAPCTRHAHTRIRLYGVWLIKHIAANWYHMLVLLAWQTTQADQLD